MIKIQKHFKINFVSLYTKVEQNLYIQVDLIESLQLQMKLSH